MDALYLVSDLKQFIESITSEIELPTKKGHLKAPNVYEFFLPEKSEDEDYPFVIVSMKEDEDDVTSDDYTVKIKLIIGVYDDDGEGQGMKTLSRLGSSFRIKLKEKQLFGAFSLTGKIKFMHLDEQVFPYFHALMELEFDGPGVTLGRRDYGEHF